MYEIKKDVFQKIDSRSEFRDKKFAKSSRVYEGELKNWLGCLRTKSHIHGEEMTNIAKSKEKFANSGDKVALSKV